MLQGNSSWPWHVQFPRMNVLSLVNRPYVNRVTLIGQNLSLKYCQYLVQTIRHQKSFRSFKRGTVSLCRSKGCKVVDCQTLRMISLSRTRTRAALVWFNSCRSAGFFSVLQLWKLVILQPFDLQRLTVPLLKDLNLLCWHNLCPKD